MSDVTTRPRISVILPCLDEAESIGACVAEAQEGIKAAGTTGEVLVVDNGSQDKSIEIACNAGARVVSEPVTGYGAALRRGIQEARGDVGVMADADLTYALPQLGELVAAVDGGAELVLANRLAGVNAGTMPFAHRVLGTPVLSFIVRRLSGGAVRVRDSQSGYRAFDLEAVRSLRLRTSGMEFASEMLVQAAAAGYKVDEIRLPYRARSGESKLHPMRDGIRHLKLLAFLDPRLALLWPGLISLIIGVVLTAASLFQPSGISVGGSSWQPVFFAPIALVMASLLVVGYVIVAGGMRGSGDLSSASHVRLRRRVFAAGAMMFVSGLALNLVLFIRWVAESGEWAVSLALAGVAQALILSGAVWVLGAFLYWLIQRASEYDTSRR